MSHSFEVTVGDICNVLRLNSADVADTMGKSFVQMAVIVFDDIDTDEVACAALSEGELDDQTNAAYEEIANQLRGLGILLPQRFEEAALVADVAVDEAYRAVTPRKAAPDAYSPSP